MGWQTDEYGIAHEGWPVAVLGDGSEPPSIEGNSSWWLYDGTAGRPRAVAVRAGCECGWRGTEMHPITWDDHEATDGFEYGDGPWQCWESGHIARLLGGTVPDELADAIETVRRMLAGLTTSRPLAAAAAAADVERLGAAALQRSVTAARESGTAWSAIGQVIGTTRQAAWQRFATVPFKP